MDGETRAGLGVWAGPVRAGLGPGPLYTPGRQTGAEVGKEGWGGWELEKLSVFLFLEVKSICHLVGRVDLEREER